MQVKSQYSFKGGAEHIGTHHPDELKEVFDAVNQLDALTCLSKESAEKTKSGRLLYSPGAMNDSLKMFLHHLGWTESSSGKGKRVFKEPRHYFGKGRYREMDGLKNKVGLEIQFGKYSFMGYDIFSKMVMFNKLGYIECGIEVVPVQALVKQMSSGVASYEQLLIDLENRGPSDIDIPVYVLGIDLAEEEKVKCEELQALFKRDRELGLKQINLIAYNGSRPGPKKVLSDE